MYATRKITLCDYGEKLLSTTSSPAASDVQKDSFARIEFSIVRGIRNDVDDSEQDSFEDLRLSDAQIVGYPELVGYDVNIKIEFNEQAPIGPELPTCKSRSAGVEGGTFPALRLTLSTQSVTWLRLCDWSPDILSPMLISLFGDFMEDSGYSIYYQYIVCSSNTHDLALCANTSYVDSTSP
ncbi:uncharacterized protein CLUP02_14015 [Colletotrichum lupini]|uniref:Uncharacterized protein n=1 Tax=Colletotrichum lupini TaxID=145971 RepID=A0A9Q8WMB1_9PEZI|nr:uncharacterized protein CLUP02_14015 [Colletotrichum lupini]UQC88491.1 hypothetical protein CLUP02_14015 [Colletotrichum lupini]